MDQRVHKFRVDKNATRQHISMPNHAVGLSVTLQGNEIYMYCQVDIDKRPQTRTVYCYYTGTPHDEYARIMKYVGSVTDEDALVYHIYMI